MNSGSYSDNYNSCDSPADGSFIIRNSSDNNVSYIDGEGDLCLIRRLYENADL